MNIFLNTAKIQFFSHITKKIKKSKKYRSNIPQKKSATMADLLRISLSRLFDNRKALGDTTIIREDVHQIDSF